MNISAMHWKIIDQPNSYLYVVITYTTQTNKRIKYIVLSLKHFVKAVLCYKLIE